MVMPNFSSWLKPWCTSSSLLATAISCKKTKMKFWVCVTFDRHSGDRMGRRLLTLECEQVRSDFGDRLGKVNLGLNRLSANTWKWIEHWLGLVTSITLLTETQLTVWWTNNAKFSHVFKHHFQRLWDNAAALASSTVSMKKQISDMHRWEKVHLLEYRYSRPS